MCRVSHDFPPLALEMTALLSRALMIMVVAFSPTVAQTFDPNQGILLRGTVVTMDASGTILHNGNILVRDGKIVAAWNGTPPKGTPINNAVLVDFGSKGLIFPGLINLHNHRTCDVLELWPPPSSQIQANLGRPLGTEPYANRYHRR
jgi:hypothetical protein